MGSLIKSHPSGDIFNTVPDKVLHNELLRGLNCRMRQVAESVEIG